MTNKIFKWVKEHKTITILSILGLVTGSYGIYYLTQLNKEGSNIWIKNASLDELEKYREKVGFIFRISGLYDLSDKDYDALENHLHVLDNRISDLRWGDSPKVLNIPHTEHGWYLPESD